MSESRIIPPGEVLPPMDSPPLKSQHSETKTDKGKKKGTRHTRDRFAVLNSFVDAGARLVDPTAQACWWVIYRETKPNGLARVSHSRMGKCIGKSRHTAMRAVGRLEEAGLLTVVRRGGLIGGASTYRVNSTPITCSANDTPTCSNSDTGGVANGVAHA